MPMMWYKKAARTSALTLAGPDHNNPLLGSRHVMATGQSTTIAPAVEYRDIPGFPGYRVGDDGSVWSLWVLIPLGGRRGTRASLGAAWVPLARSPLPSGRLYVSLTRDGKRKNRYVAHLVLEAFCGVRPRGQEACHEDGEVTNNRATNLRWDTHAGNMADKIRHGTHNRGVQHNMVKLTEEAVREGRRRSAAGESYSQIAASLGVSKQAVADLVTRRTWGHLND